MTPRNLNPFKTIRKSNPRTTALPIANDRGYADACASEWPNGRVGETAVHRRSWLAMLAVMPLVGCGFAPVYGSPRGTPGGATGIEAGLARVRVGVIAGRSGQILRNLLIDRLNPSGLAPDAQWRLAVTLEEQQVAATIGRDAAATRGTLTLTAVMRLTRISDGAEVLRGTEIAVGDYNVLDDPFANDAVLRDARQGTLEELRDDITARLFAFLSQVSRS